MREDKLSVQSIDFAVQIINLVRELKSKKESIISNQIGRSGTSIGANIREAQYAHGKNDFIAKLQIALKEASETGYWLELLFKTNYIDEATYKSLSSQCTSIRVMLISSINTAKQNSEKSKYTYGTLESDTIEAVYNLEGNPVQQLVEDYSKGVSYGSKGSYFINICETTCGGVVAYGEGRYVYSPDRGDKNGVKNALIQEFMKNNN